jgi:hypothetical protein
MWLAPDTVGNRQCRCPRNGRQGHAWARRLNRPVLAATAELPLSGFATSAPAPGVCVAGPLVLGRHWGAPYRGQGVSTSAPPACRRGGCPRVPGVRGTGVAEHVGAERGAAARKPCAGDAKVEAPASCPLCPSLNYALHRTLHQRRCACWFRAGEGRR